MHTLSDINFYDFYYNGHFLSEYGGYIGSTDGGLKRYSLLPSRSYVTDRPLGLDGKYIFDSYLEPRTFSVPVVFEELDDAGIRQISGWLNTSRDSRFYFADDSLYINAVLDTKASDFDSISGIDGECELNFIANDPYYYALIPSSYTFENTKVGQQLPMVNAGNIDCYPKIMVDCGKAFEISVLNAKHEVIQTFSVDSEKRNIELDSKYCTCISGDLNLFDTTDGEFLTLPTGVFYLAINQEVSKVKVDFVPRYI